MKNWVIALLLLTLTGCATFNAVSNSPLLHASVRIAVAIVLENNPTWAAPAYQFTTLALEAIKTQEIGNLGIIDDYFLEVIGDQLLPEEQDLAIDIFDAIKQEILADLRSRGITQPEAQKVYIIQALSWVNQSAAIRLKR